MSKALDERIFDLAREMVCKIRREVANGLALTPLKAQVLAELETEIAKCPPRPHKTCLDCPGCSARPVRKTLH